MYIQIKTYRKPSEVTIAAGNDADYYLTYDKFDDHYLGVVDTQTLAKFIEW